MPNRPVPPEVPDDLRSAAHDLLENALDRRILLHLHEAGELRFADLFRIGATTSKNHFQRSLDRLQDHILIDRRIQPAGKRYWSTYDLTSRGRRFAAAIQELAQGIPDAQEGFGQALREELLATPAA